MLIPNKNKDTLNNPIDSLDTEFLNSPKFLDWPKLSNKKIRNISCSRSTLSTYSKENCIDYDISVISLELEPKTWNYKVYK